MSKIVKKVGDIRAVQLRLWRAVLKAESILESPGSNSELQLKAIHCLIQLSGQYISVSKEVRYERGRSELCLETDTGDLLKDFRL
jgi:hypothetical protein